MPSRPCSSAPVDRDSRSPYSPDLRHVKPCEPRRWCFRSFRVRREWHQRRRWSCRLGRKNYVPRAPGVLRPSLHEIETECSSHPRSSILSGTDKNHLRARPVGFDFRTAEEDPPLHGVPVYWDFKKFASKAHAGLSALRGHVERHRRDHRVGFLLVGLRLPRSRRPGTAWPPVYAVGGRRPNAPLRAQHHVRGATTGPHWDSFFPVLALGGSDHSKWWKLFYGLAGYDRREGHRRAHAFWVPFNLK